MYWLGTFPLSTGKLTMGALFLGQMKNLINEEAAKPAEGF